MKTTAALEKKLLGKNQGITKQLWAFSGEIKYI